MLRSPFFCLLDETIFWLARHPQGLAGGLFDEKLPGELDERKPRASAFAAETLRDLRGMKDRVPVARLIREALDRTAYDAILLAEFLGERKLANLYKLIEQARSFDESGVFSSGRFHHAAFGIRRPAAQGAAGRHAGRVDGRRAADVDPSSEGAGISRGVRARPRSPAWAASRRRRCFRQSWGRW